MSKTRMTRPPTIVTVTVLSDAAPARGVSGWQAMIGPEQEPDKRAMPLSWEERQRLAATDKGLTDDQSFAGAFVLLSDPLTSSPNRRPCAPRANFGPLL